MQERREGQKAAAIASALLSTPNGQRWSKSCETCPVRSTSICGILDGAELRLLEETAKKVEYRPRETIFTQGSDARFVYALTEGTVRLYRLMPDGRRQIVGFLVPGDLIGPSLSGRYGFSADAVAAVFACRIAHGAFSALIERKPALLWRLYEAAAHELMLAQDHMVLLGRATAEEKVAAFFLGLQKRARRKDGNDIRLDLPMSRQDIADYLGLTLETVSRTITRFGRQNMLAVVPDGVRILDPERLATLAAN